MLAALVLVGVAIGVAIVYYWNDITDFFGGYGRLPTNVARWTGERADEPAPSTAGSTLDALSEAVESGAGLPAVARAAAKVLDASVALIDRSSAVLAVAAASPDEESKLLAGGEGVASRSSCGSPTAPSASCAGARAARGSPDPALLRMVTTLLALELERSRSPEWASEEAAGDFVGALLAREVTDRGDIARPRRRARVPTSAAAPAC